MYSVEHTETISNHSGDTWIQDTGYRDTGIQGYRDTGIKGYRYTGIQEYRDTGIQGSN